MDLYLVVCVFFVFGKPTDTAVFPGTCDNALCLGALMEYAAILLLLKKRRRPRKTIDEGLKSVFPMVAANTGNGDVNQTVQRPERKKVGEFLERILSCCFSCSYHAQPSPAGDSYCVSLLTFLSKILEEGEGDTADLDIATSSNGLTRVLPPNTPDLFDDEGCGERLSPRLNICTVLQPEPISEQVTFFV